MNVSGPARGTILVVDDDADIVRFVEMNLRLEGYRVLVARDGFEALEMVAAEVPDLVLLDVMMPGFDGVEVTRRLRADSRTSTLPIIMLTAKTLTADRVLGLTTGADDYIIKPFDTLELVARVRSTLRRNAEARAVSPLTSLPGNVRIEDEIAGRVAQWQSVRRRLPRPRQLQGVQRRARILARRQGDPPSRHSVAACDRRRRSRRRSSGTSGATTSSSSAVPNKLKTSAAPRSDTSTTTCRPCMTPTRSRAGTSRSSTVWASCAQYPLVSVSVGIATSERRSFE